MPFFKYYQTSEKGQWQVIQDAKELETHLAANGAKKITILSVSEVITESTDLNAVTYKGPFYIDIDSGDLTRSIDSAISMYDKLLSLGVAIENMEIFASGSKGFHFYVHPSVLGLTTRGIRRLPKIYGVLARDLFVPGMDFQVYCAGRGNTFRIPNIRRDDGRYKVQITPAELRAMTPAEYVQLTSQPRPASILPMVATKNPPPTLLSMWAAAQAQDAKEEKEKQRSPVADAEMVQFAVTPPECVRELSNGTVRPGVTFNQLAMQLGIFLARSGMAPTLADSLVDLTASKTTSTTYATEQQRRTHLQGLYHYLKNQPSKSFSCQAMRGAIGTPKGMCDGCPLHSHIQAPEEVYEIVEKPDGYYVLTAKSERRLTNFVMVPHTILSYQPDDGEHEGSNRRQATYFAIERNHETIAGVIFPDDAWNGQGPFLAQFTGVGDNLRATVSNQEVQMLKQWILRDVNSLEAQEVVVAAGVHRQDFGGKPRYTYVEKGLSVNRYGVIDTHVLQPRVITREASLPQLKDVQRVRVGGDLHMNTFTSLMNVNEMDVTVPMLGWEMACHLKAHIFGMRSEFPLLNLWGGRGSGKTQTAMVFTQLSGADYFTFPPPVLHSLTDFAFLNLISSTTTIPRIFDEFNTTALSQRYFAYSERFKAAFNGASSGRGKIRNNTQHVDNVRFTAPCIILSEHQMQVPALRDRTAAVYMSATHLAPHTVAFEDARKNRKVLHQIAKEAVLGALDVRDEWVQDHLDSWFAKTPTDLTERQRFCRAVIGVGLEFAEIVLGRNMKLPVTQLLDNYRDWYAASFHDPAAMSAFESGSGTTEIDFMISKFGELRVATLADQTPYRLTSHNFRLIDGRYVDLEPLTAYPLLRQYLLHAQDRLPVASAAEFSKLLQSEPYFVHKGNDPAFALGRTYLRIDLEGLAKKGVDVASFR